MSDSHYIDNKVFYSEMVKWKKEWNKASKGKKLPNHVKKKKK